MTKILSFILMVLLVSLSVINIFADQITLKNGDRLTGKVIRQDDETIVLQTEFTGVITISKANIEKIMPENIAKQESPDNDLRDKGINTKAKFELGGDVVAETEIKKEIENKAAAAGPSKAVPKRGALSFTTGWDGAANIGFSLTTGNSKNTTFSAGVRAEKSGERDKWTTYINSLWNRNRVAGINVTTSNAIWGGLRYDRNITKKMFGFGSYDFERDKPQRLNFRSVIGGGLGYHAIKNDRTELDFFGGVAWNRTWFIGSTRSSAEILAGNTLKHKFNERVNFQQGFTFYPNITNRGEYRYIFDSTLSADITKRIGWFVKVADRYNSLPLAGIEKNDFLFATGLKVGFGKTK